MTQSTIDAYEGSIKNGMSSYLITINTRLKGKYKKMLIGSMIDSESNNEREIPKHSRIIVTIILDWIWRKVNKLIDK